MIAIVAAIARGGAIGYQGRMPWELPEDLRNFRTLTWESFLVMGRRTFESIGKPLPGRTSIVVTSATESLYRGPNPPIQVPTVGAAIARADGSLAARMHDHRVFAIGGAGIFAAALPLASRLYLTELDFDVVADTFWTPDLTGFREIERRPGRTLGLSFVTYERVAPAFVLASPR